MHKQPLLILAVCFILGILFQDKIALGESLIDGVALTCLILLVLICFHSYFLHKTKTVLLMLLLFGAGIILHFYNTSLSDDKLLIKKHEKITFMISQKLNSSEKYRKYEGIAGKGSTSFNAIFYVPKDKEALDFIHYYNANAYITQPQAPPYDFQFNYAQYLKRKHIRYQIYISEGMVSAERHDLR